MKVYTRLTEKGSDIFLCGEFHDKYTTAKENIIQYDTNKTYKKPNCCFGGAAIEKLADLENKIESGELCERGEFEQIIDMYKHRAEVADIVISELRAKLSKAENDRDRYARRITLLQAQKGSREGKDG